MNTDFKIKNIDRAKVTILKEEVSFQKGQVVSKTLVQNSAVSVTLFAFDKDEEISAHESGGGAVVSKRRHLQHGRIPGPAPRA